MRLPCDRFVDNCISQLVRNRAEFLLSFTQIIERKYSVWPNVELQNYSYGSIRYCCTLL